MTQRTFISIAGFLFLLIALGHALRLLLNWEALINGWAVPRSLSWIAMGLSGFMAYTAFGLRRPGRSSAPLES